MVIFELIVFNLIGRRDILQRRGSLGDLLIEIVGCICGWVCFLELAEALQLSGYISLLDSLVEGLERFVKVHSTIGIVLLFFF